MTNLMLHFLAHVLLIAFTLVSSDSTLTPSASPELDDMVGLGLFQVRAHALAARLYDVKQAGAHDRLSDTNLSNNSSLARIHDANATVKKHSRARLKPTFADVGYKRVGGGILKLDIYLPKAAVAQLYAAATADLAADEMVTNGTRLETEVGVDLNTSLGDNYSEPQNVTNLMTSVRVSDPDDTGAGAALMNMTASVLYLHGNGWWRSGTKNTPSREVLQLVAKGIAVVSVEYRLTSQVDSWGNATVTWPAQGEDMVDAVNWLKESGPSYGLDPANFGCWGESAGGHLCAWMATAGVENGVGRPAVAVNVCGPACFLCYSGGSDLLESHSTSDELFGLKTHGLSKLKKAGDRADPDTVALVRSAEPLSFVTAASSPMFIAQGALDESASIQTSKWLAAAYRMAGVDHKYEEVPNADRPYVGWPHSVNHKATKFVQKYLTPGEDASTA